jgi:hypothetical protein
MLTAIAQENCTRESTTEFTGFFIETKLAASITSTHMHLADLQSNYSAFHSR